jgi:hypothetical protein
VVDELRAAKLSTRDGRRHALRATRNLLIMGTVYPFTGALAMALRRLLTGGDDERMKRESHAEFWLRRYLEGFVSAGGLGLLTDFSEGGAAGRLLESMIGPGLSTVAEGGEAAASPRWRRTLQFGLRHIPARG